MQPAFTLHPLLRRLLRGTAALALVTAIELLATAPASCASGPHDGRVPNVVIILADDMGYGDVGCYGATGYRTPHLDRMAAEGMRFTDFHVAESVCTASRVGLLTGCYPTRVGLTGAISPRSTIGIHDDEILLPEILKEQGYATACYGKWHLGHHQKFLPTRHGFDDFFGLPYSNDMWPNHPKPTSAAKFPPLPLVEGETTIATNPDQTQLTTWYTERAVAFIEANRRRPFFLYVPHAMPHVPLFASDKHQGTTERGLFGDVISEIDWSVGQILGTLNRLELDENTLVIFTSDNGPWLSYGNHAGSAGPLREGKHTTFEGGFRVPCIMRWSERIPQGTVSDELVSTMDLLPTIAQLAGSSAPTDRVIDGHDIRPILFGQPGAKSPWQSFYYYKRGLESVRSGPWKLHLPHLAHDVITPGTDGMPGETINRQLDLALYNLDDDVAESINLAEQYPEVVQRLQRIAEAARHDLGDKATDRAGVNTRPVGEL